MLHNRAITKILSKLLGASVSTVSLGRYSHNAWPKAMSGTGNTWRAEVKGQHCVICARASNRLFIPLTSETSGETEHQGWPATAEGFANLCAYAYTRWVQELDRFSRVAIRNQASIDFHAALITEYNKDGGYSNYVAHGNGGRIVVSQKSPQSVRASIELASVSADDIRMIRKLLAPFLEAKAEAIETPLDDAP